MDKIVLDKNKSIGKVVFIVEGDKKEHTLLEYIFEKILDYSVVDVRRNRAPYSKYISKINPDSRIFVISAESSNVRSAGSDGKGYLDQVFSALYKEYSLDISNAAVYYIYDRDNESNFYSETEKLPQILSIADNILRQDFRMASPSILLYWYLESFIIAFRDFGVSIISQAQSSKQDFMYASIQG